MELRGQVNNLIEDFNKEIDNEQYLRSRAEEEAKKNDKALLQELSKEIVSEEQQKIKEQKNQVILKKTDVVIKKLTGQVIEQA